jgi:hypothetical protein
MRAVRILLTAVLVTMIVLVPVGRQLPLDPDQPLAIDGSATAGRARTIFQFDPLLGAFDEPRQTDDPRYRETIRRCHHESNRVPRFSKGQVIASAKARSS